MGWRYWQAIEQGKDPESLKPRGTQSIVGSYCSGSLKKNEKDLNW